MLLRGKDIWSQIIGAIIIAGSGIISTSIASSSSSPQSPQLPSQNIYIQPPLNQAPAQELNESRSNQAQKQKLAKESTTSKSLEYIRYKDYYNEAEVILNASKGIFRFKGRKEKIGYALALLLKAHDVYPQGNAEERYRYWMNRYGFMEKPKNRAIINQYY